VCGTSGRFFALFHSSIVEPFAQHVRPFLPFGFLRLTSDTKNEIGAFNTFKDSRTNRPAPGRAMSQFYKFLNNRAKMERSKAACRPFWHEVLKRVDELISPRGLCQLSQTKPARLNRINRENRISSRQPSFAGLNEFF
jgi:hypothetical protein